MLDGDAPTLEEMVTILKKIGMNIVLVSPDYMDKLILEITDGTARTTSAEELSETGSPADVPATPAKPPKRKGRDSDESVKSAHTASSSSTTFSEKLVTPAGPKTGGVADAAGRASGPVPVMAFSGDPKYDRDGHTRALRRRRARRERECSEPE